MSHCGGGTKCGGGAKCGGGPSVYERWRNTLIEWWGKGLLSFDEGTNAWNLISVMAGQSEGAEVDAERVRSEGVAGLSVETLDEWERIYYVERIVSNPDVRRWILLNLTKRVGDYVSPADAAAACDEFFGLVNGAMAIASTEHTCTIAECTTADNAGDGVRYWALLVPEWVWRSEYRAFYWLFRDWANRVSTTYNEVSLPVTHDSGEPRFLVSVAGGTESGKPSIVDRDVVRD
jgi:hypothetical protein